MWFAVALLGTAGSAAILAAPPSPYDEAVSARTVGDLKRADEILSDLVKAEPANADAHLQYGYTLLGLGQVDRAADEFRTVLQLAPTYTDAKVGLALVAERRHETTKALTLLNGVDGANRDASELRRRLKKQSPDPLRTMLDVEGSQTYIGQGRPDWLEGAISFRRQTSPNIELGGRLQLSRRFANTDVSAETFVAGRPSRSFGYRLAAGMAPGADFLARWHVETGLNWRARSTENATVLTLTARHAEYRTGPVETITPGIEQYLAGGKVWFTGQWINSFSDGNHHVGWLARGDWQSNERLRLYAGAANAPDTSEGLVLETFSLFTGLSYAVSPRRSFRLSVNRDDPSWGPVRTQLSVGLSTAL